MWAQRSSPYADSLRVDRDVRTTGPSRQDHHSHQHGKSNHHHRSSPRLYEPEHGHCLKHNHYHNHCTHANKLRCV